MLHVEIIALLVCTNVQCTNDHSLACHSLCNLSVNLELFFLCWEIFFLQINKLTSEKTDSTSIILNDCCQILDVANISVQHYFLSVKSNVLFSFKGQKKLLSGKIFFLALLHLCQSRLIRIYIKCTVCTVYNSKSAINLTLKRHGSIYKCRNRHGPCKNRCMGIQGTFHCNKRKNFILIQLYSL